ncbi:LOW QUALITY PROTEIN: reverse transcriptase [Phytophthora megakarya]|uniref:Reverse transcriptase n=1 Tax=Phytophthora megakarya TaxID=4795 RepID=A0A225X393_9STRA|nr:LOW QUALITY PROTEIN: reverse transcriptase [Phytophthora megakarya]
MDPLRLVICGDSKLLIPEIDCKPPGLTLFRQNVLDRLQIRSDHELVHVKWDWNGSTDSLTSAALQRQCGAEIETDTEVQDLITFKRLEDKFAVKTEDATVQISAIKDKIWREIRIQPPPVLCEEVIRELRIERIRQAQDEEAWIHCLKKYLADEWISTISFSTTLLRKNQLWIGTNGCDRCYQKRCIKMFYIIITRVFKVDIRGSAVLTIESGITFTGEDSTALYKDMSANTGKGRPRTQGGSSGSLQAPYPFQIIARDHILSLPRCNTELLIFGDLFSGYVIAKANGSRTAHTMVESSKEYVFRRFGVSEVIRHDRESGFMSNFFRAFNKILGQHQRATIAYRPQANGSAERMVPTSTRALKIYVQD